MIRAYITAALIGYLFGCSNMALYISKLKTPYGICVMACFSIL